MSKSAVHVEVQRRSDGYRWVLLYCCTTIDTGYAPTKTQAWARGHRSSAQYRDAHREQKNCLGKKKLLTATHTGVVLAL